jgi:hypothetical protein
LLRRFAAHADQSLFVVRKSARHTVTRALLALVVGYVAQTAIVGGINPKIMRQDTEGLVAGC